MSLKFPNDEFVTRVPNYDVDHYLTRDFRDANLLIKDFNYDLSQLDRRDLAEFIQKVFEPEFLDLVLKLQIRNLYINKDLFHIFKLFIRFVPNPKIINSVYYNCCGHIGFLQVQVCEKHLFDDDGILLSCPGGLNYKTYLRLDGLRKGL